MTELRPPPGPKTRTSHRNKHAFLLLPSGHPLQLAHVSRPPRSQARENQSQGDVSNDRLCLGQMQAAICSPSTQSHLATASPHHCRCPTHLFPSRHGEEHCLQCMGKLYTPMVCSAHKPVILPCFPTKSPFQANLINIISISQIGRCRDTRVCWPAPSDSNNSLLFSLYGCHPLRLSCSTFN